MSYEIHKLFQQAVDQKASDLLITAGAPPMLRVNGELTPAGPDVLTPALSQKLLMGILTEAQAKKFELSHELDLSLAYEEMDTRFRVNLYMQRGCVGGAFRAIHSEIPPIKALGMPPVIEELALRHRGLVLITGPTGNGKSTTQAAMIGLINRSRKCHIVTVEDPIEFVHKNVLSVVDQREVGQDTESFPVALKFVLRQDPDVILLGEMRDLETISAAITAAETGHLVISTLHTNDTVQSVDRIIDVYPAHQQQQIRIQLAFCLIAVVAQQLIPRADGKGMCPAAEILVNNPAAANLIREGKTHQIYTVLQTHAKDGMVQMDDSIRRLFREGLITHEEAAARVKDPRFL